MKTKTKNASVENLFINCSHRRLGSAVALFCLTTLLFSTLMVSAQSRDLAGKRSFTCYQGNAYIGAMYEKVLAVDPRDLSNLLATVTQVYQEILASDPPMRMAGLAAEIAAAQPEVVGLEELWTVERAAAADPQLRFTVDYDYLQLLTNALAATGAHYRVAIVTSEQDVSAPMMDLQTGSLAMGRVVDHEAILVRTDLPPGFLRVGNPRSGHYTNQLQIPSLGLTILRGWCSVDVLTRGEQFRFICAHFEDEIAPEIQQAQGRELLAGPANVNKPVVIVGDFNSDPLGRTGTTTYNSFIAAGFKDAWAALNRNDPAGGLTWGHDPYLSDPGSFFNRRIDFVLYRGGRFTPVAADILDSRLGGAQPPLWASDHARLTAAFLLGNNNAVRAARR